MNNVCFTVFMLSAFLVFLCITADVLSKNNVDTDVLKYSYTTGKKLHMRALFQSKLENVMASDPIEHSDKASSSIIDGTKGQDGGVPDAQAIDFHTKAKDASNSSQNNLLPQPDNKDGGGPGAVAGAGDENRHAVKTHPPSGTSYESGNSKEEKQVDTAKDSKSESNDTSDTLLKQSDSDSAETSKTIKKEISEEKNEDTEQSLSSDAVLKKDNSEEMREDAEKSLFEDTSPKEDTSNQLLTHKPTEIKTEKANISFFVQPLLLLLLFLCVIIFNFVC